MIVDKNPFAPVAAKAAPGRGSAQGPAPDRAAWLREMEKQELAAWLSHPATQPGHAAASQVVYAPINPPAMQADASAPDDAVAVGSRLPDHDPAPTPVDTDRPGTGEDRSGDRGTGRAAAGDSGRLDRQVGMTRDDVADSQAEAPSGPAQAVAAPVELAAAVMAVLAQDPPAAVSGAQVPLASTPSVVGAALVETSLPATEASAPLATPAVFATVQRAAQPGTRSLPAGKDKPAAAEQEQRASRTEQAGMPEQSAPQLRIHAVRTSSGVRVWIGADQPVGLGGQQLLLAVGDIRRLLKDQGVPLASLTYNGESVYDADDAADAGSARAPRHNNREE